MAVLEAKNREMMEKKKKKQPTTKEKLMKKNQRKHATKGPKKGEFPKSICRQVIRMLGGWVDVEKQV